MARLTLIVTLTVARTELDGFRRYEHAAAAILRKYGGAIERVIEGRAEPHASELTEVHLVSFPNEAAFDAYRGDPELGALSALRERSILRTQILFGADRPPYGS